MATKEELALRLQLTEDVLDEIEDKKIARRLIRGRIDGPLYIETLWLLAATNGRAYSFSAHLVFGPAPKGFDRKVKNETRTLETDRWLDEPPEDSPEEAMTNVWRTRFTTVAALSVGKNHAGADQVILWHSPAITAGSAVLLLKSELARAEAT